MSAIGCQLSQRFQASPWDIRSVRTGVPNPDDVALRDASPWQSLWAGEQCIGGGQGMAAIFERA